MAYSSFSSEQESILASSSFNPNYHSNANTRIIPRVPGLPEGKTHHLFFSHSSDDHEWVGRCVQRLERDYELRCFWPPRDFLPGRQITSLVQDGMSRCLKIVLVLSPNYIDSGWCEYERHLAFVLSVQQKENCIIPVMLEPCYVPDVLKTLNYIDVTRGENVERRIVKAFTEHCDLKDILPNFVSLHQRRDLNGSKVTVYAEKIVQSSWRGTAWLFQDLTQYQHELLKNNGTELSTDMYGPMQKRLNRTFALRYHGLLRCGITILLCFVLTVMASWLLSVIGIAVSQLILAFPVSKIVNISAFTLVSTILANSVFFFICRWITKKLCVMKARKVVKELSLDWFQQTNVLIFYSEDPFPCLIFMFYDILPCQEYIRDRFMMLYSKTPGEDGKDKETLARNVSRHHIKQFVKKNYDRMLKWAELEETVAQRHETMMRKKCVCEMLEQNLWEDQIREVGPVHIV